MELLEGETLGARLAARPLELDLLLDLGDPDRRRARIGARQGHRPSRHQAREHLRQRARPGEDPRLRAGQDRATPARQAVRGHRWRRPRSARRSDDGRHDDGHRLLHVARAGPRPAHRRAHGSVLPRHGDLPDGDRVAAVPRRHLGGRVRSDSQSRSRGRQPGQSAAARRTRPHSRTRRSRRIATCAIRRRRNSRPT